MIKFEDVSIFLDLVSDPKRYKAYIDDMIKRQADFEALLEVTGKAEEIPKLNAAAKQALSDALMEADKIKAKANAFVEKQNKEIDRLNKDASALMAEAQVLLAKAKDEEAQAVKQNKEAAAFVAEAKRERDNLEVQKETLAAKEQELNSKLAILKSLQ